MLLFTSAIFTLLKMDRPTAVIHQVEWTTPIFLSGYKATGSLAGAVLQLFLLYQPQVDKDEQRICAEALLRWKFL